MKIAYDGKRAVGGLTGLGNYSRLVLETLSDAHPDDTFTVLAPRRRDNPRLQTLLRRPNVEFVYKTSRAPSALWRSYGITKEMERLGADLYHGLSNELPLNILKAHIPTVLTMHDVIYRRLPECYTRTDRFFCDFKYSRSCRAATRIIAISERTKADIIEFYGVDPDKIDVVYQGCDDIFRHRCSAEELQAVRTKFSLPVRYILQVGTIEQRKNLELTIRALSAINDRDIHLVAVGKDRLGYQQKCQKLAEELGVADRVHFLSNVGFSDLPAVCQGAEVIVYPSRYEGFGIPVLEALESRRPLIAATGSCLEEAGGDAAIYVDPDDVRAMAEALNGIISGATDTDGMIARGVRHAARFSPATLEPNIWRAYERAIEDFKHI